MRFLESCVEWFNAKDLEFGNVIETEEREDICAVLEELAFVWRAKGRWSQRSIIGGIGSARRDLRL